MNDTFHSISDLVADAEDLLVKLARAQSPEIRALKERVQDSIDDMRDYLRRRVKSRTSRGAGSSLIWGIAGAIALVAIAISIAQMQSDSSMDPEI